MDPLASINVPSSQEDTSRTKSQLTNKLEPSGKLIMAVHKHTLTDHRYHAHSEVQRGDGLYGGLVVHRPRTPLDKNSYQYDKELLFLIGDWYHWSAEKVLANFMDRTSMGNEVCS